MFDTKSDYALNKRDPDAIVCRIVTDLHIRLTREDFDSEEEFQIWKNWSDEDYHASENESHRYYDRSFPLVMATELSIPSSEEDFLAVVQEADYAELLEKIRSQLTDRQYRRLRMYYLDGMTEAEIAKLEGVGHQRISKSIAVGKKNVERFLEENPKNRGQKHPFFRA